MYINLNWIFYVRKKNQTPELSNFCAKSAAFLVTLAMHKYKLESQYKVNFSIDFSSGSVESLKVEFEEEEYVLQDLAQISRKNPKTLIINMSSFPQLIPVTMKALNESGMNVNPQQEGTTIIIPIPKWVIHGTLSFHFIMNKFKDTPN